MLSALWPQVERAIDALERQQRPQVLGGGASEESGARERALALADHKAVANVQALLASFGRLISLGMTA